MGYDFKNASGNFRLNYFAWPCALTLAKNFGWEPMGTVLQNEAVRIPDGLDISDDEYVKRTVKSWKGYYDYSEFQLVIKEDALNLGRALKKAVEVIPDERVFIDGFSVSVIADGIPIESNGAKNKDDFLKIISNRILEDNKKSKKQSYAIARFSGLGNKAHLNDFIKFCMNGEFYIS